MIGEIKYRDEHKEIRLNGILEKHTNDFLDWVFWCDLLKNIDRNIKWH